MQLAKCSLFVLVVGYVSIGCAHKAPEVTPAGTGGSAKPIGTTYDLCTLLGPSTGRAGIYGSDLGITVSQPSAASESSNLSMLFGDTWAMATSICTYPVTQADDLQATLPATRPAALKQGQLTAADAANACTGLGVTLDDASDPTSWRAT
ncbi:MAG TPA: hypothetical protein VHZ95_07630, partial [Polyangiales bacterium]|nr:hypothetical protein [Polyangiales bacterium]